MTNICPVTGVEDCASRDCELHYMDAPLTLAPRRKRVVLATVAFLAYLACIPLANLLIQNFPPLQVWPGIFAPAGVLVAGLAFTARDLLQHFAGRWSAVLAILLGTALSFLLADARLAIASGVAFLASEALDMAVFTPLERRSFLGGVAVSNAVSALVDSMIFLSLAFGSLAFLPGQLIGKLGMTALALLVLMPVRARLRAI